ncbi:MAG: DUF2092 domain-containing protein [Thermodesulfobacteriota bacterium]
MSVSVESSYDTVQKSGQIIEFGAITYWHVKRPNKVRVEIKYKNDQHYPSNNKQNVLQ